MGKEKLSNRSGARQSAWELLTRETRQASSNTAEETLFAFNCNIVRNCDQ